MESISADSTQRPRLSIYTASANRGIQKISAGHPETTNAGLETVCDPAMVKILWHGPRSSPEVAMTEVSDFVIGLPRHVTFPNHSFISRMKELRMWKSLRYPRFPVMSSLLVTALRVSVGN